ncbi:hypothetical protein L1887_35428 [Cichorium endivia]|nr:hypothetical protein L1887_35428 [Cichorium endivia]
MYRDLRSQFWWPGMKPRIVKYISKCSTCAQVKAEHQVPYGKMQSLQIPAGKWDDVTMDFVMGLPRTSRGHNAIWVIVDRLTKSALFLAIKETTPVNELAKIYVDEVVRLHRAPLTILSDRDARFTARFWQALQEALGSKLPLITAYHPQTDGQSERTIQTLEDMLRACVIDFGGRWDDHLPLVEFSYNNSYHSSIGMPPFEALYGRKCRTPLCWLEAEENKLTGPDIVAITNEKIKVIQANMKATQDRQRSYASLKKRRYDLNVGDLVMLKVSPWKGVMRFGKNGKLSPRYVGPFKISKNYFGKEEFTIPWMELKVDDNKRLVEEPEAILELKTKKLRNKEIDLVLVKWKHSLGVNLTWETKGKMLRRYPNLVDYNSIPRTESA